MDRNMSLTEGNIMSSLLKFTVPVFFALFLQALYGGVDLLIVGRFAQTADVSGVGTGSTFTFTPTQIITGLSTGLTVVIGEKIGRGDGRGAAEAIGCGICLFAAIAVALTAVLVLGADFLASLMHAPEEAFTATASYIRICGAGMIFSVAYNVLGAVFRGLGDSATPLLTVAIACAFNIAADLLLVGGFRMGAAGAAIATVTAQAFSVLISLRLIQRRGLPFSFGRKDISPNGGIAAKILKIGAPIALQELFVGASFIFVQSTVNTFGVIVSAGVGVAEKVSAFVMLVPSAYMQSMAAFTAQNLGAGKKSRAKKALRISVATAFAVGVVMFCLQYFSGDVLASFFTKDADAIAAAHDYLKSYGIDSLICPMMFCFAGFFNGCEKSLFVMLEGLIGALLVRTPYVYFASMIPGITLFELGLGTAASSCVQLALCLGFFIYLARKEKR